MKAIKKIIAIVTLTLLTSTMIRAQVDPNYHHPYNAQEINAKGEIMDAKGIVMGKIEKDGTVKDNKGVVLGYIASDGSVTDKDGKKMGKGLKNGNYQNFKGETVITMNEKGEAKDYKGHVLYKTHPDFTMQACAIHCFFGGKCCEKGK